MNVAPQLDCSMRSNSSLPPGNSRSLALNLVTNDSDGSVCIVPPSDRTPKVSLIGCFAVYQNARTCATLLCRLYELDWHEWPSDWRERGGFERRSTPSRTAVQQPTSQPIDSKRMNIRGQQLEHEKPVSGPSSELPTA